VSYCRFYFFNPPASLFLLLLLAILSLLSLALESFVLWNISLDELKGYQEFIFLLPSSHKNLTLSNIILTMPLIEYLRGTATSDECEPLFAKYKQCLSVSPYLLSLPIFALHAIQLCLLPFSSSALLSRVFRISKKSKNWHGNSQRALKERGIDKMLDEARADNRENDLENMKPNW